MNSRARMGGIQARWNIYIYIQYHQFENGHDFSFWGAPTGSYNEADLKTFSNKKNSKWEWE